MIFGPPIESIGIKTTDLSTGVGNRLVSAQYYWVECSVNYCDAKELAQDHQGTQSSDINLSGAIHHKVYS